MEEWGNAVVERDMQVMYSSHAAGIEAMPMHQEGHMGGKHLNVLCAGAATWSHVRGRVYDSPAFFL